MAVSIYCANETDFSHNGLGLLTPLECTAEEVSGGKYELNLTHPIDESLRWTLIQPGCILKADAPLRESPAYESTEEFLSGSAQTVTRRIYKANTERMHLRLEPKVNTVKLCSLPHRTEVILLDYDGKKWAHVTKLNGGQSGYCPFGGLTFVREEQEIIQNKQVSGRRTVQLQPSREQLFRIYATEQDSKRRIVTARAMHIFYDESANPVMDTPEFKDAPLTQILSQISAARMYETPAGIRALCPDVNLTLDVQGKSLVEILMDPESGILKKTGALLLRDNYESCLLPGPRESGVTIRRNKNLIGVTVTQDISSLVTRIIPVGRNKNGDPLRSDAPVDSPRAPLLPCPRCVEMEFDVQTGSDGFANDNAVRAELVRLAQLEFSEKGRDLPVYGMEVDFALLSNAPQYERYAPLQSVHLHDQVTVIDELLGVKAVLKVTAVRFNCLTGRYEQITLGDAAAVSAPATLQTLPGSRIIPGSLSGAALRDATIRYAKIANAAVEQLSARALTALTARIQEITANHLSTDELAAAFADLIALRAGSITADEVETDALAAALARITALSVGSADFDRAAVTHLVSSALNLEFGTAGRVFIRNLAVEYAQMVGAAIANLCIRAADGNYYRLDVQADGSVRATPAGVTEGEIAAGQTEDGSVILETSLTAETLSAGDILAAYALINRIDAARIDVDALFAREAFLDRLRTAQITSDTSLSVLIGRQDEMNRWFSFDDETGLTVRKPAWTDASGTTHPASVWSTVTDETGYHIRRSDLLSPVGSFARNRLTTPAVQLGSMVVKSTARGGWVWKAAAD